MSTNELNTLKTVVEDLWESLTDIKSRAEKICDTIDAEELIPITAATELEQVLGVYRSREQELRDLGEKLSLNIGTKLGDITATIQAYEENHSIEAYREIVLSYFRLSSQAADVKNALERTKLALIEKCNSVPVEQYAATLEPYAITVTSATNEKVGLEKDVFKRIQDSINFDVAFAVDRGQVFYDPDMDISKYTIPSALIEPKSIDVSAALQPESVQITENDADTIEIANGFDSYIDDEDLYPTITNTIEKAELSEIKTLAKKNRDALVALWKLAHIKLVNTSFINKNWPNSISYETFELLNDAGLLAELEIPADRGRKCASFATLSTKGWSCFKDDAIRHYLSNHQPPLVLPDSLRFSDLSLWDEPGFVHQAAFLSDFCTIRGLDYIMLMQKGRTNDCYPLVRTTGKDGILIVPALFVKGTENKSLSDLTNIINEAGDYNIALLTQNANDILPLAETLENLITREVDIKIYSFVRKDTDIEQPIIRHYGSTDTKKGTGNPGNVEAPPTFAANIEPPVVTDVKAESATPEETGSAGTAINAVNRVKENAPSASKFKGEISKLASGEPLVYFVLPLLSNLGACTIEQMERVGSLFADKLGTGTTSIRHATTLLASKGFLAHFRLLDSEEGELDMFGLSSYAHGCLKKKDVSTGYQPWILTIGKRIVGTGNTATSKELKNTYFANEALLEYLEIADKIYEKNDFRIIHTFTKWLEDHYEVVCINSVARKRIVCGLLHKGLDPTRIKEYPLLAPEKAANIIDSNGYPTIGNGLDYCYTCSIDDELAIIYRWQKGNPVGESVASKFLTPVAAEPEEDESAAVPLVESATPATEAPVLEPIIIEDTSEEEAGGDMDTTTEPAEFGITPEMTHKETAAVIMEQSISPRYFLVYQDLIYKLTTYMPEPAPGTVVSGMAQALLLARSLAPFHSEYLRLCEQLAMALDSDITEHHYTNKRLSALYGEDAQGSVLHLLSIMRALFLPENAYDNNLLSYAKAYFDAFDSYFEPYYELKPFYKTLLDFMSATKTGFTANVRKNFINNEKRKAQVNSICAIAETLCTDVPRFNKTISGIPQMLRNCFGENSDVGTCMRIIADNDVASKDIVEVALSYFCESDSSDVVEYKIYDYIEKKWRESTTEIKTTRNLFFEIRLRLANAIQRRLDIMKEWLDIVDDSTLDKSMLDKAGKYHSQVCKHLASLKAPSSVKAHEAALINHAFTNMERILGGEPKQDYTIFGDILRSGYFCIDDGTHLPVMFDELPIVPHYEPWTNVLRHILTPERSFTATLDIIRKGEDPEYRDNLGQAIDICDYCNTYDNSEFAADIDNAKKTARQSIDKFNGELELALAYNRIDEKTKEGIAEIIIQHQPILEENANFGALHVFLDALRRHVAEISDKKREMLERSVARLRNRELTPEMEQALDAIQAKISGEEQNFVVAEEYINLFDAGVFNGSILAAVNNTSHFLQFISAEVFNKLLQVCDMNKSRAIRDFGAEYVEKEFHRKGLATQYQRSAKALLASMPPRPNDTKDDANPERISTLMKELGFNATGSVRKNPSGNLMHYIVYVSPDEKGRSEYIHPVAEMGTTIKPQLDVIFLFGQKQPNDIVDTICNMELNEHAIVFLNGALDLASRRQLAERFHREKSGRNPFLLIDWVLLLHLASFPQSERMSVMLNCTMPYTSSFNPFVTTSAVPLPDEMYIGRKDELSQITDPHGPVFVYGGRQLGKTALLEKAARLKNKPEKKEYGIKVQMGGVGEEFVAVERICDELTRAGIKINACATVRGLCKELTLAYDKGNWQQLFIFIDEADAIIAAFKQQVPTYDAIVALSELMKSTNGNFKFVMAGLHDVCRAANDPNTVFGQFGKPLVIRPLEAHDALELLCKPLRYLGFKLDLKELEVMLLNTSFYPGIIHFVGYNLVQNLSSKYGEYYQANRGNPPYELSERQLGDIMNANAINTEIDNRICWTLDVDKRYLAIARCIAYLYHDQPQNNYAGHSAETIREYADIFEIPCLAGLTKAEFDTLLHELVEMRILIQLAGNTYRLRMRRFLDAIGNTPEKIEADIAEDNRNE